MSVEHWFQTRRLKRRAGGRLIGSALAAMAGVLVVTGASAPAYSADTALQNPVRIQSELLEAEMDADTAEFSDAVRVDGDGYTITADRLTIQFQQGSIGRTRPAETISAEEISRMTARGRVRIQTDSLTAEAEQAIYEPNTGMAWLGPAPAAEAPSSGLREAAPQGRSAPAPSQPPISRVRVTFLPGAGR